MNNVKIILIAALSIVFLSVWSCIQKQEEISLEELGNRIERILASKYSEIKTLDELLIAQELFIKERIALIEEDVFGEVKDAAYILEESIYLMKLLEKHIDENPGIVIPKLICLFQYAGAADAELLSEMLSMHFVEKPEIFIKSVNKQILMEHLQENFRSDEFIEHVYHLISRPLFDGCDMLSEEECNEVVTKKLKDVSADNDFFEFLKQRYGF